MKRYSDLGIELEAIAIARIAISNLQHEPEEGRGSVLEERINVLKEISLEGALCVEEIALLPDLSEGLLARSRQLEALRREIAELQVQPIDKRAIPQVLRIGFLPASIPWTVPLSEELLERLANELTAQFEVPEASEKLLALIWKSLPVLELGLWLSAADFVLKLRELVSYSGERPWFQNPFSQSADSSVVTEAAEVAQKLEKVQEILCRHLPRMKREFDPELINNPLADWRKPVLQE